MNVSWLIKGFLPRTGVCGIYGDSYTGKSFIAVDIAFSVATGADYCGHSVKASGGVFYIAGEDAAGIVMRSHAYRQYHNITGIAPIDILPNAHNLSDKKVVEAICDEIALGDSSPRLVIVDTLATCFDGDENSAQDMNKFMDGLRTIKECFDCCVVFVHHTGHKNKDRARGSSVLYAALDAEYIVKKQARTDFISVECTKLKNNTTGKLFNELFHIESVELGVDEDGDQVSSGVVINDGESEMTDFKDYADQIKITGKNQKLALVIVDEELGVTPDELRGLLRAEKVSQPRAYETVDNLVAKGALIESDGVLEIAPGVVAPARENL